MTVPSSADVIEEHRTHLLRVAYRLTGSLADAQDAVQETWLRLARLPEADRAAIRDPRGWLTTVVGRLCLDRLRSAAVQRERYIGTWLPEALVTRLDGPADPLDEVVRDDGVRMAALVVLERLAPEQRVAFVLHDALSVPFAEIADVLDCSVPAARQHASRARRAVAAADPPARVGLVEQRRVLDAFLAALAVGDLAGLVGLLHPDAAVIGDGGGKERTARRPVRGADKVARFIIGLLERYGPERLAAARLVLVNGDLGMVIPPWPGDSGHPRLAGRVSCFAIRDGQLAAIYDIVNPDKIGRTFAL
ncbi:MAG: RNA polymerase sigma factor SigJ [Pseudonocardiaceae bacterium]